MITKVHIENIGTFYIDAKKLGELIAWCTTHNQFPPQQVKEISQELNKQIINE